MTLLPTDLLIDLAQSTVDGATLRPAPRERSRAAWLRLVTVCARMGGRWDAAEGVFRFPSPPPAHGVALAGTVEGGEAVVRGYDVPMELAERMARLADRPGDQRVLVGVKGGATLLGAIAGWAGRRVTAIGPGPRVAPSPAWTAFRRFMRPMEDADPTPRYDVALLAPPLALDGLHVERALSMVRRGGVVVALVRCTPDDGSLDELARAGRWERGEVEPAPGVRGRLLRLVKA